jgi:hypothetical protein
MAKLRRDLEFHVCYGAKPEFWVTRWLWDRNDKIVAVGHYSYGYKRPVTPSSLRRLNRFTPYSVSIYEDGVKIEYTNCIIL